MRNKANGAINAEWLRLAKDFEASHPGLRVGVSMKGYGKRGKRVIHHMSFNLVGHVVDGPALAPVAHVVAPPLTVCVPEGAAEGAVIQASAPDGRTFTVLVPPGAAPGSLIQVTPPPG